MIKFLLAFVKCLSFVSTVPSRYQEGAGSNPYRLPVHAHCYFDSGTCLLPESTHALHNLQLDVKTCPAPTTARRPRYARNLELATYQLHRIIHRASIQQL